MHKSQSRFRAPEQGLIYPEEYIFNSNIFNIYLIYLILSIGISLINRNVSESEILKHFKLYFNYLVYLIKKYQFKYRNMFRIALSPNVRYGDNNMFPIMILVSIQKILPLVSR